MRALTMTRRAGLNSRVRLKEPRPRPKRERAEFWDRLPPAVRGIAGPALRAAFSTWATKLFGFALAPL